MSLIITSIIIAGVGVANLYWRRCQQQEEKLSEMFHHLEVTFGTSTAPAPASSSSNT
jgi:hypothetical protein